MAKTTTTAAHPVEESLFRRQAVEAFNVRSYGRPIATFPKLWSIFGIMILAMLLFAAWYLCTSEYSRKETVRGWLVPDRGLIRLSAGQYGLVSELRVDEGDHVAKGQIILVLSSDTALDSGKRATDILLSQIESEEEELQNQIKLTAESTEADTESLKVMIDAMNVELSSLRSQVTQQRQRIEIDSDLLKRLEALEQKGVVPKTAVSRQREDLMDQRQTLESLTQRLQSLGREQQQHRFHLEKLPLEKERATSELRARLSEISRRKTELATRGRQAITSPIAGSIASLGAKSGSSLDPQTAIASILPANSVLFAEVYIPSRAMGFVEVGKDVRLMYEAFPHQRFGSGAGKISKVGNAVLHPEEIPTPLRMDEPAYKTKVLLSQQTIEAFGRSFPLRPGMALTAEIILEKRTFLEWLLEPVLARRGAT